MRRALTKGIDLVAEAVHVTFGPRGRNMARDQHIGMPIVINNGMTIARGSELANPFENMGAQLPSAPMMWQAMVHPRSGDH